MQVFVTFPELELAAVSVTVGVDSLVSDVLKGAAFEWDVDPEEVELSFAGDTLDETERLADHGLGADSEMEMRKKLFRLFGKCWFVDESKREKLLQWLGNHNEEYLNLDTPTFSEDGCLSVSNDMLPSVAERISFRNSNSNIKIFSQQFLQRSSITSLDLSGLSSVTTIGGFFVAFCSQLTSVDLTSLSSVTTIGLGFLYECSKLTAIDLSGLSSVTTIGEGFAASCSQLTAVDLSGLSSVTTIGNGFLSSCSQLTAIELSGLRRLTTIGSYFLYECSKLTAIDLSGLSSVTTIGRGFLSSCSQLTALDLSGFSSLTTIGSNFLSSCSQLTALDLSSLSSVTEVGDGFLHKTIAHESVQLPSNNRAVFEQCYVSRN